MIKKLTLENFKNFRHAELELGPFTLLIGANATGKSNVREAFRFLHGIGRGYTLPEIIGEKYSAGELTWSGIRGGTKEISSIYDFPGISSQPRTYFEPNPRFSLGVEIALTDEERPLQAYYFIRVYLRVAGAVTIPQVDEEYLECEGEKFFWVRDSSDGSENYFSLTVKKADGRIESSPFQEGPLTKPMLAYLGTPGNYYHDYHLTTTYPTALPETNTSSTKPIPPDEIIRKVLSHFQAMRFLEPLPGAMRRPSFPGQTILTDRGENLSSVLHSIWNDSAKQKILVSWLEELTPIDVKGLAFSTNETGQISASLVEEDGRHTSIYSISDGTLRFLGILAALLGSEPVNFHFFEELENGIHPTRLHLLTHAIENQVADRNIQVIVTTHSPLLLNYLSPQTIEYTSLLYRLEDKPEGHIKRIVEIPYARDLIAKQGVMRLYESGWFEDVVSLLDDDETVIGAEAVA